MIQGVIKYTIPLSLLLLSACSQHDEPGADVRRMEFSVSISETPRSRVSETADGMGSVWSSGDKIFVKVTQGGATDSTYCTLNSSGKVTAYSQNLFWNGTGAAAVVAYYSNIAKRNPTATSTVDLADQTGGLAYVLRAEATANYGQTIQLTFAHQLAKVRVKIEGDKASEVTGVKINNYSSCNIDETGYVTAEIPGYITMRKNGDYFEANVVPESTLPSKLLDFGEDFEVEVSNVSTFEAGKIYTITIDTTTGSGSSSNVETTIAGHPAVLMREAGKDGDTEPLYVSKMNLGASNTDDYGLYFWWGDVVGTDRDNTTFLFESTNSTIITYDKTAEELESARIIYNFGRTSWLTADYDAAMKEWGDDWWMPTEDDILWLIEECDWTYQKISVEVDDSGYRIIPAGYKVKSKTTGGEIFLPFGGKKNQTSIFDTTQGWYWTATTGTNKESQALNMTDSKQTVASAARYYGFLIRPISYGPISE